MSNNVATALPSDVFFDDFSDGIWTKYPGNPVIRRDQPWAESDYICEPNLVYRDGLFHMWFSQMFPPDSNRRTALGYATSRDGFVWTKHPGNPVLRPAHCEAHRPHVFEHKGTYYCFGIDNELTEKDPSTMRRWMSRDGLKWSDEQLVMTADQEWEGKRLSNMAVIVDDDGTWKMLYTRGDPRPGEKFKGAFGYAYSRDGVHWIKHEGNPVNIIEGYGGDPFLIKIGKCYYAWHSHSVGGMLRIDCRCSEDMINWRQVGNGPNFNITQPWERGVPEEEGGTTSGYYGHITDATLCEADGSVYFIYQGAQTPLGVATFDGDLKELAERLKHPPLAKWLPSPYGMVEGGVLKIADNGAEQAPLIAPVPSVDNRYIIESRIQCYAGVSHRVSVIIRHGGGSFARFWLADNERTYYQEKCKGLLSEPRAIGANHACDDKWHDWKIEVDGEKNRLYIDGRMVGECRTSPALMRDLSKLPVQVGFSVFDAYAGIAHVRVS